MLERQNRCLHHFLALVVGVQVGGALAVVGPGSVDAEHLLPPTRCITMAVGPSWGPGHSQDTVGGTEEV